MNTILCKIIFCVAISSCAQASAIVRDVSAFSSSNSTQEALNISGAGNSSADNGTSQGSPYWLDQIKHRGTAAFRSGSGYQVYRNVKEFGARGDGISDDTVAFNLAISSGNRCNPGSCEESTTSPALIYVPEGTYLVSAPIVDFYYTQIIGNPNNPPILKATENFTGFALIDGNPYRSGNTESSEGGSLSYEATNVFFRQIRNLILDTTAVSAKSSIKAIHWPTAQATSLENLVVRMNDQSGTQHQGLFIESGSGGFMSNLKFYGGLTGALMGSQQFTSRDLWFYNAVEAIEQVFDWGWTYKSIHIVNCSVGLNMTNVNPAAQSVGSVVVLDSFFANTPIGIATSHDNAHWSVSNGSLILENVSFENVHLAVQGTQGWIALPTNSGNLHVQAWGIGHQYAQQGPQDFLGTLPAVARVASLTAGSKNGTYYERSKPDYRTLPVTNFLSLKATGAKGDGITDDTEAVQRALDQAGTEKDRIVFFDAGTYRVTSTLHIPKFCKMIGEGYATIMSSGKFFGDMANPKPVVQVGGLGDVGSVEWSDMIVSTQGSQPGAILIEWNLASTGQPSGMWDVHTRIGGFSGSKLGAAECAVSSSPAVAPSSREAILKRQATPVIPRFDVGFSVYEGVVTPTYLASLGVPVGQATSAALEFSSPQPSPALPAVSSISDNSISSIEALADVNTASTSIVLPPTDIPSPAALPTTTKPILSSETELMANATSFVASSQGADSTSFTSPAPTLFPSSLSTALTSTNSAPLEISSILLSSSYDSTSQEQLGAPTVFYPPSNTTGNHSSTVNEECIGAFMSMHITKSASGLYMENVWLWTADHDLDAPFQDITVYSGRGLLVESQNGNIWMVGTSSEHHSLYQYQLAHTQNIVLGQMQSETAYYQPGTQDETLFSPLQSLNDPNAADMCTNGSGKCNGYGLRILDSQHVAIYGAGLYSFFDHYNKSCALHPGGTSCQQSIFSIEGSSSDITVYNLNTIGAASMVDRDGTSLAKYSDNVDVFPDTIALFRLW